MRDRTKHYVEVDEWESVHLDGEFISVSDTVKRFLGDMGSAHVALRKFSGARPMKFKYQNPRNMCAGFIFGSNRKNMVWLCREEMSEIFGVSPRSTRITVWVKKNPLMVA